MTFVVVSALGYGCRIEIQATIMMVWATVIYALAVINELVECGLELVTSRLFMTRLPTTIKPKMLANHCYFIWLIFKRLYLQSCPDISWPTVNDEENHWILFFKICMVHFFWTVQNLILQIYADSLIYCEIIFQLKYYFIVM